MAITQKNRHLAISTALEEDKLLIKTFSMTEHLGRLFQMEVELLSKDCEIKFDDIVGTAATVQLKTPKGGKRFFNGYVSRFVQAGQQGGFAVYRATLVPWLWFLTRASDCRIFQKKKVPDILEEVFKGHGFKDYTLKLNAAYGEWDYCVQYRETDFNFVSRLMEQEGIYYFFKHTERGHTLVLTDSPSAHEPFENYATLVYRPPTSQRDADSETVTDWVIEQEIQPGLFTLGDFNPMTPKASILGNANISRSHVGADYEMFDYPGRFENRDEGEARAKLRIQELQAQHEILRAQTTVRGVAAGCKFTLKSHPRPDQNRDHLVTGASFEIRGGGYETGGNDGGEAFACSFTAIPAAECFRSPRATPKPLIRGPQTAIVVGPKGEEIYTDDQSRVKVHFHWDRHGASDENASCWVRVSQSAAGKGWGAIAIPRIGQEVVIEFLEGDPDKPLITGRVYNADQTPPYTLPANKTQSGMKSRSSKDGQGFNEIRFEDKNGEEHVFFHCEKDQEVRVKNDVKERVGNDRNETVDGAHREKIGKDRHLKVTGKQAAEIGGKYSLTVAGDMVEVFKANHSEQTTQSYYVKALGIVLEGSTGITLKCGGNCVVIDPAGVTIKGNKVTIDGSMVMIASGPGSPPADGNAGTPDMPEAPAEPKESS